MTDKLLKERERLEKGRTQGIISPAPHGKSDLICGRRLFASTGGYSDGFEDTREQNIRNAEYIVFCANHDGEIITSLQAEVKLLEEAIVHCLKLQVFDGDEFTLERDSGDIVTDIEATLKQALTKLEETRKDV